MPTMNPDDDVDDDDDDEFDDGDADDEDGDEDEDDDPDADVETWQVSANSPGPRLTLNSRLRLTSGNDLPRLARTLAAQLKLDQLSWSGVPAVPGSFAGAHNRLSSLGCPLGFRTEGFGYADRDNCTAPD